MTASMNRAMVYACLISRKTAERSNARSPSVLAWRVCARPTLCLPRSGRFSRFGQDVVLAFASAVTEAEA